MILKLPSVAKIPKEVAYEDAAVLPLGINTAASCLFMEKTLGLDAPSLDGTRSSQGKTLLVWGASSSVGSCSVQMATQAGYQVVGVASKRNHEMVKGLGASICFDQSDPTLIDDIVTCSNGEEVVGAYNAIVRDPRQEWRKEISCVGGARCRRKGNKGSENYDKLGNGHSKQ